VAAKPFQSHQRDERNGIYEKASCLQRTATFYPSFPDPHNFAFIKIYYCELLTVLLSLANLSIQFWDAFRD
jgi:hypothetical protein